MGAFNGCFSADGSKLIIGTDYGAIQIYGSGVKDFYMMTPV